MSTATWTPTSETDLEDIYAHIAFVHGRRQTAKNILREIREECDKYASAIASGFIIGGPRRIVSRVHTQALGSCFSSYPRRN
jgi:hypothetical protein